MKKRKIKNKIKMNYWKFVLKKTGFAFVALLLILSQSQVLSAFEAHVINVTATIRNDIPTAEPPTGEFCAYDTNNTVTLGVTLPSAYIWYTTDGSDPVCDGNGQQYTGPITLSIGITTIKARSCHDGKQSVINSWTYDVAYKYCEQVCDPNIELVTNGGFETPVVGTPQLWDIFTSAQVSSWTVEWMSVEPPYNGYEQPVYAYLELHRGVNGWVSHGPEQHAELDTDWDGPSGSLSGEPASVKIYQDISTIPDENYTIKFYFSPRPDTGAANNQLQFSWDGVVEDTISRAGGGNTDWSEHIYNFTAAGATTRLQFADVGIPSDSLGTFLDDVSVRCMPRPNFNIVLNELLPNPEGEDYGFDFGDDDDTRPQGEWVEIYNKGDGPADLAGWYIQDEEPDNTIYITNSNTNTGSTIIPAHGWLVAYMNQAVLDNDGDAVSLYDLHDNLIDSYIYVLSCHPSPTPGEPNICDTEVPGNKSYARIPDGTGAWFDPIPTPGGMNKLEEENIVESTPDVTVSNGGGSIPEPIEPEIEELIEEPIEEEVVIEEESAEEPVEETSNEPEESVEEPTVPVEEIVPEPEDIPENEPANLPNEGQFSDGQSNNNADGENNVESQPEDIGSESTSQSEGGAEQSTLETISESTTE